MFAHAHVCDSIHTVRQVAVVVGGGRKAVVVRRPPDGIEGCRMFYKVTLTSFGYHHRRCVPVGSVCSKACNSPR